MHKFEAFKIRSFPHLLNSKEEMLANLAMNICPSNDFSHDNFFCRIGLQADDPGYHYKLEDI